ncbi:MAG TPA: T9SS type A sorting domain-containing protein [Chitinophagaceae bacterium]|nr:T9SS type A sorting domain-containing protein [Chitinophagaceae bacterium]
MKKTTLQFLLIFLSLTAFAQNDTIIHGKIPIEPARWYQLNNVSNGLQQLFDGDLYTRPGTGWGKILSNYDSYYPVPDGMDLEIDSVKMFDWEGTMVDYPATFYVITDTSWQRRLLATFTGERYNGWDGPYPGRPDEFALDTPAAHVKYIVLNSWYEYPTEVEFYGSYKPVTPATPAVKTFVPLKNFLGINAFEWDFEDPANPMVIDETRMTAIKSFTAVRHYMDWQKLESQEGKYTYCPVHSGGWNYDTIYARCKAEGITVLADLKTLPDWMLDSYPSDQRDAENVPVQYGKDFADPASYIEQGKVAFQYAARYGSNKKVKPSLLSVDTTQRWTNDDINTVKIGLNTVKYIECDNERDKWWKGRRAYQTGREYAANLSAFYDGNKKKLGINVGVKNADPKMMVVMCGLASANTDYVRGMIDWCKEFRGYKANGAVDLCWDIVNYHIYANDARYSATVWPTTGVAPELSIDDSVANAFIQVMHEYAADMPVWITETGYDTSQGSPQKAIPVGTKSALETQADWTVRTALTYARSGIQRLFFYELVDDNPWSSGPYATSGLINNDRTRRPAADYIYQLGKTFGGYAYQRTVNSRPVVDKYIAANGKHMYAIWEPSQNGVTENYSLDLEGADTAIVYRLQKGADKMTAKRMFPVNGHITITASETPLFVQARFASSSLSFNGTNAAGMANLQWQATNDSAINYYTVERSNDDGTFIEIGKIPANRKDILYNAYIFNDETPAEGVNYYRLRQTAADSAITYSETIALQFGKPLKLKIYPNPATHVITITGLPGKANTAIVLLDNDGKMLSGKTTASKTLSFDISKYADGVYYVKVQVDGLSQMFRFIKGR